MSSDRWTIFLQFDQKSRLISVPNPTTVTVWEFMKTVLEETGLEPEHQRLIIGNRQFTDNDKDKRLSEYGVADNTPVCISQRLIGGSSRRIDPSVPRSRGPCIVLGDTYNELECVVMPCGHVIHPDMLIDFCHYEVYEKHRWEIACFLPGCTGKCSTDFLMKCGGTQDELNSLFKEMSANYCKFNDAADIRQCPGCQCICERMDKTKTAVRCALCTRRNGKSYDFCWLCSVPWTSGHQCRKSEALELLASCAETTINGVKCPGIRACPNCGVLIEHHRNSKRMKCLACQQEFCFVCLALKTTSWPCGSHQSPCTPAQRQMAIESRR